MAERINNILLRANTALFAQKLCGIITDMTGAIFTIQAQSLRKSTITVPHGFICFITFAGMVQGIYLISMSEETAAGLAGIAFAPNDPDLGKTRATYASLIIEILNISVGKSIAELEKKFDALTITPPVKIFGEMEYPKTTSGNVAVTSGIGTINCSLAINMSSLKIVKKLN